MIGRKYHARLEHEPCSAHCYMMNEEVRARLDAAAAAAREPHTERHLPADDAADKERDDVTTSSASSANVSVAGAAQAGASRGRKRKRALVVAEQRENASSAASSCSEESDSEANTFGERSVSS